MTRRQLQILRDTAKYGWDMAYIWDSVYGLRFRQMIRVSRFESRCLDELLQRRTVDMCCTV